MFLYTTALCMLKSCSISACIILLISVCCCFRQFPWHLLQMLNLLYPCECIPNCSCLHFHLKLDSSLGKMTFSSTISSSVTFVMALSLQDKNPAILIQNKHLRKLRLQITTHSVMWHLLCLFLMLIWKQIILELTGKVVISMPYNTTTLPR